MDSFCQELPVLHVPLIAQNVLMISAAKSVQLPITTVLVCASHVLFHAINVKTQRFA